MSTRWRASPSTDRSGGGGRIGSVGELPGAEFEVEFSGDGDDFHLCVPDVEGLLVARGRPRVTVESVDGTLATLRFEGQFDALDGEGGRRNVGGVVADFVARVEWLE